MKIKVFTSAGHDLGAAMTGLEEKINEWLGEAQPKNIDLQYSVVPHNDRLYATAVIVYGD